MGVYFYDVETLGGFEGKVGLIGFKKLNGDYIPFFSSLSFIKYLEHLTRSDRRIIIYGFNSYNFDFKKILDDLIEADYRFEMSNVMASGSMFVSLNLLLKNVNKNIRFIDLRGCFRHGSLNSLSKELLNMEKNDFDVSNLKEITKECIEYNKQDLILTEKLFCIASNFFKTDRVLTSAGMSFRKFREYYGKEKLKQNMYRRGIRECYYGGRSEIFKMRNVLDDAYYYDVNSLYPYVMKEFKFPVGPEYYEENNINKDGYSYAIVNIPSDTYIPYVPYRFNSKLIFPVGKVYGCWTNFELRKMRSMNYDVKVLKSFVCDNSDFVFSDYITDIYNKRKEAKANGNKSLSEMYKLAMNSLYGKFGKKQEVDKIKIVLDENLEDGDVIVHSIKNYNFVVNKVKSKNVYFDYIIASHITAYARTVLYEYMRKAGFSNMIYCDTDSCITYGNNLDNYVGNEIGEMKLEYVIKKGSGVWVLPKTYGMKTDKGLIVKMKGFGIENQEEMYNKILNNEHVFMNKQRILGMKESMRRSNDKFFNLEIQEKHISAIYTKRIILPDGLETKPIII